MHCASPNRKGAETYAPTAISAPSQLMNTADGYATRKHVPNKPLIAVAREKPYKLPKMRARSRSRRWTTSAKPNERQASADAEAQAKAQADDATRQKEQAQSDQAQAEAAKSQAESMRQTARTDAANAQSAAAQAKSDMADSQAASPAPSPQPKLMRTKLAWRVHNRRRRTKRHAGAVIRPVESDPADARQRSRTDRQHVRSVV
jgi:hypothetical protein